MVYCFFSGKRQADCFAASGDREYSNGYKDKDIFRTLIRYRRRLHAFRTDPRRRNGLYTVHCSATVTDIRGPHQTQINDLLRV